VQSANPSLPAGNILHFVQEEVATLADGFGEKLPVAAQNQVEILGPHGLEAIIFKVRNRSGPRWVKAPAVLALRAAGGVG